MLASNELPNPKRRRERKGFVQYPSKGQNFARNHNQAQDAGGPGKRVERSSKPKTPHLARKATLNSIRMRFNMCNKDPNIINTRNAEVGWGRNSSITRFLFFKKRWEREGLVLEGCLYATVPFYVTDNESGRADMEEKQYFITKDWWTAAFLTAILRLMRGWFYTQYHAWQRRMVCNL